VRRDPPPDPSEQTIPGRPSGLVATAGNGQVALSWTAPASGASSYTVTYYDPALATVLPAAQRAFWKVPPGVVEPHIVGGGKVSNSDHPYQVALLTATDSSGFTAQFCSGTLVAPRWVVTAAHCVANKTAAGVDVGVGKDDLSLIGASDRHVVSAIHVHPSYDSATYANDIALLQLSTAVTSSTAKWIPWQTDTTEPAAGTTGTVSGWGTVTLDESIYRNDLQGATVKVLESPGDDLCGAWDNYSATEKLCVGGERNVGACTGDSGGPLAINLGYTHLVGIASYGSDDECADVTYPNVMTRVSNYDAWLQSHIGNPWVETTPTTTSATVTGLANGTDYTFYVTAINADGNSSYAISAAATPYTVPGTPTGLTATQGVAEVALSWTAPASNGGSALTDYTVEYSSDSGTTWTTFADGTSTTASTTVTGLSHSTTYTFRISALNAAGTGTASDTASVATATTAGAPTGLTATPEGTEATLSWTAPASNGGSALTDYTVEYSSDSGATWTTFADGTSTTTSTTVTGLSHSTTYTFRVSAVNIVGTGTASATSSASTASLPGAPTVLAATVTESELSGTATVALSWTAPTSNGGSALTDYTVEYSSDSGSTYSVFADGTSTTESATVTGLSNATTYTFRVAAVNSVGTGSSSSEASTTTYTYSSASFMQGVSFAPSESTGSAHPEPAIAIGSNGFPVIAYYGVTGSSQYGVKIDVCSDATCSSKTSVNVDTTMTSGGEKYLSLAIGNDGNPILAYYDHVNDDLKVAACGDAQCSTLTSSTLNQWRPAGMHNDIAIGANGNPVISYTEGDADPILAICADPTCSSATWVTLEAGTERAGNFTSIVIGADGNPVISYYGTAQGTAPVVAACADQTCSSVTLTNIGRGPAYPDAEGMLTSMALGNDDLPVIVYEDEPFGVRVAKCTNATCTAWSTLVLSETSLAGVGAMYPSVAVGTTGYPFITYTKDFALHLVTCADEACTQSSSVNLGSFGNGNVVTGDLVVDNSGSPVMIVNPVGGGSGYLITQ